MLNLWPFWSIGALVKETIIDNYFIYFLVYLLFLCVSAFPGDNIGFYSLYDGPTNS